MRIVQTQWFVCLTFLGIFIFTGCGSEGASTAVAEATEEASEVVEETVAEDVEDDGDTANEAELAASAERGSEVYNTFCVACHMPDGNGLAPSFPPLAKADYLMADATRAIRQVIYGKEGEMVVNGVTYNGIMPAQPLDDEQTADVLNYVMNEWGNEASMLITPEMVKEERE